MAQIEDRDEELKLLVDQYMELKKKLQQMIRVRNKLKIKTLIPKSVPFLEYEKYHKETIAKDNMNSVRGNFSVLLQLYGLCGIKFIQTQDDNESESSAVTNKDNVDRNAYEVELSFSSGPNYYTGYKIEIERLENGGYGVANYILPVGLDINTVTAKVKMPLFDGVLMFLQYLHDRGCKLFQRIREVNEFIDYFKNHGYNIDVFTSPSKTYVEVKLPYNIIMDTEGNEEVIFTLTYNFDSRLPVTVSYRKCVVSDRDKVCLKYCCTEFLSSNLKNAFRNIIYNKEIKIQSPENMSIHSEDTLVNESIGVEERKKMLLKRNLSIKEEESMKKNRHVQKNASYEDLNDGSEQTLTGTVQQVSVNSKIGTGDQMTTNANPKSPSEEKEANENKLETINEQEEKESDLITNEISSITIDGTPLHEPLHSRQNERGLIFSTPFHRNLRKTLQNKILDAKRSSKKHLQSFQRRTSRRVPAKTSQAGQPRQRDLLEFMENNKNSEVDEEFSPRSSSTRTSPLRKYSVSGKTLHLEPGENVNSPPSVLTNRRVSPHKQYSDSAGTSHIATEDNSKSLRVVLTDVQKTLQTSSPIGKEKKAQAVPIHKDTPPLQLGKVRRRILT